MLFSSARFIITLTIASSVLGAAIPTTAVITSTAVSAASKTLIHYPRTTPSGALWKNNVHEKVYSFEASSATPTAEVGHPPVRRSGELWMGREHEEVDPVGVPARRSGERWSGLEHEEIARAGSLHHHQSGAD